MRSSARLWPESVNNGKQLKWPVNYRPELHWSTATILSNCLYKSCLIFFFGLEWDSNPGPLTDGNNSPCIYAKPLTYHSRSASALAGVLIYEVVMLLIDSQKHWQRIWASVFTNHIWQFFGQEWESNPGPLSDGTNSPCIYAKPLTYQ